jgi:cytochrome c553
VLLALNGYEVGLLAVAAVFIASALFFALVVPRARPEFPARRLGVFIAVCIGLFVAQMTAVLLLAELGEEDEPEAAETQPGETEPGPGETETGPGETEPGPGETETGPGETETETETGPGETEPPPTETGAPPGGEGDAAAGEAVFTGSAGCAGCHTLADAGATGTIGPSLDEAMPSFELAVDRVTNGSGAMPSFSGTLSEQQIRDVATYVSSVAGS